MNARIFISMVLLLAAALAAGQQAQVVSVAGVILKIDAGAKQITVKTDAGAEVVVHIAEVTRYRRASADLKTTTEIALTDIAAGDRVVARWRATTDTATLPALQVIAMAKADVMKKRQADQAEWIRRGIVGTVSGLDTAGQKVMVSVRSQDGANKDMTVTLEPKAELLRYAPDSVKPTDAKPAAFGDIAKGDEFHALGTTAADGVSYTAEEAYFGTFVTLAVTVTAIDAPGQTLTVKNLDTKTPVVVKINAESSLKKMPEPLAQMLAMRASGETGGRGGRGGGGGQAGGGAGGAGGGRGGPGPGRGGDMRQMIDRMPAFSLTDLKVGDALVVYASKGKDSGNVTAIRLTAGVDPIFSAVPPDKRPMMLGNWSVDVGGGAVP